MADGAAHLRSGHAPAAEASTAAAERPRSLCEWGRGQSVGLARVIVVTGLIAAGLVPARPVAAQAQVAWSPPSQGQDPAPVTLPEVVVLGRSVPPSDCASGEPALTCAAQALQAAARLAQARAANAGDPDVPGATSADVVTGVANQTATRQRMGNQFGVGVRPQRPPPPAYGPAALGPRTP
jgi:hypothetical protein